MEAGDNSNAGEARRNQEGSEESRRPELPIFPSLQELGDLPQRLLPEETRSHLQNAGREALLALYSLWQSVDKARSGSAAGKVRKRIDVE